MGSHTSVRIHSTETTLNAESHSSASLGLANGGLAVSHSPLRKTELTILGHGVDVLGHHFDVHRNHSFHGGHGLYGPYKRRTIPLGL